MWPELLCLDEPGMLTLRGSVRTNKISLQMSLSRCSDPVDTQVPQCRSKEEVDELINKSVLIYAWNT